MKRLKLLACTALLLGVVATVLTTARQPAAFPADSVSAAILQSGPLTVASFDETYIDSRRPTNANGDYPGAGQRELVSSVWYPSDHAQAPYPLVVYSHGFSSNRRGGAYLAKQLASQGYVVIAADYPLTHRSAPGGPYVVDVVNQPGDVSFLIDSLLAHSRDSSHPLAGKIDPDRIGVTGISLGGLTSTLAAFHPVMGDARIKAALSIAGPTEPFTEVFFNHRQVPFLMLAADTDALVPYEHNALPVLQNIPDAQLVTIRQGSHTGFAGSAGILRWLDNPDAIGCYVVLSNLDNASEPWFKQLGTEQQGIASETDLQLCQLDPLPRAMNPLRQQMITSVVVSSFFQSQFASEPTQREAAQSYLDTTLAEELAEVIYAKAPDLRAAMNTQY